MKRMLVITAIGLLLGATAAEAHGPLGFTSNPNANYFCHVFLAPGQDCSFGSRHSWGFVSNKHMDGDGYPLLGAEGRGWYSNELYFANSDYGFTRACWDWHGGWPHCSDQDAYFIRPYVYNSAFNGGGHIVRGHGLF